MLAYVGPQKTPRLRCRRVWAWGRNSWGQLGLGDVEDRYVPREVTLLREYGASHPHALPKPPTTVRPLDLSPIYEARERKRKEAKEMEDQRQAIVKKLEMKGKEEAEEKAEPSVSGRRETEEETGTDGQVEPTPPPNEADVGTEEEKEELTGGEAEPGELGKDNSTASEEVGGSGEGSSSTHHESESHGPLGAQPSHGPSLSSSLTGGEIDSDRGRVSEPSGLDSSARSNTSSLPPLDTPKAGSRSPPASVHHRTLLRTASRKVWDTSGWEIAEDDFVEPNIRVTSIACGSEHTVFLSGKSPLSLLSYIPHHRS